MEIIIILTLIVLNGVLSMTELAMVSARKSRLRKDADEGHRSAQLALQLAEKPGSFLATVQVGITLIGIIAGVFGGATLAGSLATVLSKVSWLAPYAQTISLVLVILLITYLSLVIGELLPKRLALSYPEAIARGSARFLQIFSTLCRPIVWFLDRSTDALVFLFGIKERHEPDVSQEDIASMVVEGTRTGAIDPEEKEIIERLFQMGDRTLSSIMTPRNEIIHLKKGMTTPDAWELVMSEPHQHFPVFEEFKDEPVGIISAKELAAYQLEGLGGNWESIIQPPLIVPVSASPFRTLDQFKQHKVAMALVVDEFGSFVGIVTLHDIIEALVGDIDDVDEEPAGVTQREDGSYLVDASLAVEDAFRHIGLDAEIEEEKGQYHSVGGFVFKRLGHMPRLGEHFDWRAWRFEVIDLDRTRLDKILVSKLSGNPVDSPQNE
ncbi:MAG: HlyC/CorC family transporter [Planctomycetia bacterium]|nr:HlyC/CorC family transporter [Planctomycetia bacterium]